VSWLSWTLVWSSGFAIEVADDRSRGTHGDLDVGLEFDARPLECLIPFLKNATHGMVGEMFPAFDFRYHIVEEITISFTPQPVKIVCSGALICWQGDALSGKTVLQIAGSAGELLRELDIEQIEAVAKLNDGSQHSGFFDFGAFAL